MARTYVQPDSDSQNTHVWFGFVDDATFVTARIAAAFAPHEQSTPDMTVRVDAGAIFDGSTLTEKAAQNTTTITAPSSNPRNDIVYMDRGTGTVGVATGTEAPSPTDPAIPAGKVPVARIRLQTSTTSITNSIIDDIRFLFSLGLGTAAFEDVGTGANDVVQLDGSGKLPAVDGSQLTGISAVEQASRTNILLNTFRIAVNGSLSVPKLVDGMVDAFVDETGVDTAGSSNELYDSAGDFYTNFSISTDGTFSGSNASGASLKSGDGVHAGLQFTPSITGKVTEVSIDIENVVSNATYEARVYTDSSNSPGTQVGSSSAQVVISSSGKKTFTFSSPPSITASTTYWIVIFAVSSGDISVWDTAGQAGFESGRNNTVTSIAPDQIGTSDWRVEIKIAQATNMTLISNAFTAEAQPDDAFIVLFEEDVDTVTINTDLKVYASRNGGTTFTQATLTDKGDYESGKRVLTGTADISGQSSGTSMKWKVETLNNKELRLHGVALEWMS